MPEWSEEMCDWLMDCIDLSLDSAAGYYKGSWYTGIDEVATGGAQCVHVANITVYFAFRTISYCNQHISITFMVRFVDDGTGGWMGSKSSLLAWTKDFNLRLQESFGLALTFKICSFDEYLEFLDIKYKFSPNGEARTDLFIKETDSHRFLDFGSHHPRATFRSIVYSQGIRYRRIISNQSDFDQRLEDLKSYFVSCNYPVKMVEETLLDVKKTERNIDYKAKPNEMENEVPWITTYGPGSTDIRKFSSQVNKALMDYEIFDKTKKPVKPVFRKSSSLQSLLFSQKAIARAEPNINSSDSNAMGQV